MCGRCVGNFCRIPLLLILLFTRLETDQIQQKPEKKRLSRERLFIGQDLLFSCVNCLEIFSFFNESDALARRLGHFKMAIKNLKKKKDFYLFLLIIKTSRTVFSFKEGNFGYFPFDDAKRGLKVRALTQPAKADAPNFSRLFFPSIWKGRWYPTTATFWSFFKDGGGRSSRKARNVFSSRGLHEEE